MITKNFTDLYRILKYDSYETLERKRARLFPNGKYKVEDEVTTCNIFLATLIGIKELRERLLGTLASNGANRITNQTAELHAYTELDDAGDRPDGLLVLTTGKKDKVISWAAYIEVKTKGVLEKDQVERYMQKAKKDGVPAVITISNDFVSYANINPTGIVSNKLFHWSWKWILSEIHQLTFKGMIDDPDQHYIAQEFFKYLTYHKDIKDFTDMGANWEGSARKIVNGEKITKNGKEVEDVVTSWCREEKDIAVKLSTCLLENTGLHKAELQLTREERTKETKHYENLVDKLLKNGELVSSYILQGLNPKIFKTDKAKLLEVKLRFRGRKFIVTFKIPAKENGKAIGQTSFFLKQLNDTGIEDEIQVIANYGRKQSKCTTLKLLREQSEDEYNKGFSIVSEELKRETIKEFIVFYEMDMGKEFFSRRKIITYIENAALQFYREVTGRFILLN